MTNSRIPVIDCEQHHTEFYVRDLAAAIDFYTKKLGFTVGFTWGKPPSIAGVNLGNVQMFLVKGTPIPAGCMVYFVIGNVDELYEFHKAGGVEIVVDIGDREYELRDYRVRDLNGYEMSFGQRIYSVGGDIPVERVDVSVRLEKRLVALLDDLAAYKRMTRTSLFEETFLHALDGVGPHSEGQLRRIQELREKHGIDYDSHGSYRFEERGG